MMRAMTGANIVRSDTWKWTMGYRFRQYLADLRDGTATRSTGRGRPHESAVEGIRILVSNQFAENGGTNTDEGDLASSTSAMGSSPRRRA